MVLKYWIEDFSLFLIHIASIWHFQYISVQIFHNSSGIFLASIQERQFTEQQHRNILPQVYFQKKPKCNFFHLTLWQNLENLYEWWLNDRIYWIKQYFFETEKGLMEYDG